MASLLALYQKLNQKTAAEKNFIKAEDFSKLKEIIAEKNSLITEIEAKERAIEKNKAAKLAAEEFESLKEILTQTAKLQNENMEFLTQKKGETQKKLLELYGRKKSIKGYYNRGHQEAKFFDQKS